MQYFGVLAPDVDKKLKPCYDKTREGSVPNMTPNVQYFIKKYRMLISDSEFAELYRKSRRFLTPTEIGEMTAVFYEADVDPLLRLDAVPPCFLYGSEIMELTVADTVKSIDEDAFSDCKRLSKIVLPEGLLRIEPFAFHRCKSLETLTVPASVTEIGDHAFDECMRLTIRAPRGSYVAAYARQNGIPLEEI